MTIVERSHVLHAYLRALRSGVATQEEAVTVAAAELCLPEEAVVDAVWTAEGEVAL